MDLTADIAKSIRGIIANREVVDSTFIPTKFVLYRDELDDIAFDLATIIVSAAETVASRLAAGE